MVSVGRGAVFIVLVVIIGAAIEIRRPFVLVGSTVLLDRSQFLGCQTRAIDKNLNVHMCSG